PLHPQDDRIVAVASDQPFPNVGIPGVDINDIAAVPDMVSARAEPLDKVLAILEPCRSRDRFIFSASPSLRSSCPRSGSTSPDNAGNIASWQCPSVALALHSAR